MKLLIDTEWATFIADLPEEKQLEFFWAIFDYGKKDCSLKCWEKIQPVLEKGKIGYFNKLNNLKQYKNDNTTESVSEPITESVSESVSEREYKYNNNINNNTRNSNYRSRESIEGNDKKAEALIRKAYAITPNYAPVAIAIGDLEQDSGNIEKAYAVYDAILKNDAIRLDDKTRGEVLFKRGLISNIQQNYENAIDDLRATVKMSPLHYDALMTIAKTYAEMKQPLLALSCLQQSLLVTPDHTKRRGNTYYDMGKLWDDVFHDAVEAGIYYEGALNNGASNVDLIERSLPIFEKLIKE